MTCTTALEASPTTSTTSKVTARIACIASTANALAACVPASPTVVPTNAAASIATGSHSIASSSP
eukprot:CAMPEP_0114266206 /NCGR_PEP_ID=MMETSP0058-20121206/24473_1 /TAXON_ID=36894 /ORGANISM="Pyramimonas parkeae, CCMP726" /LENGTH=64 /DNA_ID=CAMNT_0001383645 /DNA_START=16 /DNA_END=210 /DNA_ORIENTATION=+